MHSYKYVPNWLDEKNELKSFKSYKVDADQLNKKLLHLSPSEWEKGGGEPGVMSGYLFSISQQLLSQFRTQSD